MRIAIVAAFVLHSAAAFSAPTKDVVTKVAVTGATGRTGRLVVEELVARGVAVVAMVRDVQKAKEAFGNQVEVASCDLTQSSQIAACVTGCDAAIWCATGFTEAAPDSLLNRVKKLFGVPLPPAQQSIDAIGVPALAECFATSTGTCPKVIMLSSAGVTMPSWSDEKKAMFPGAADIPIVRLNPLGILDIKAATEEKLRQSGANYCIVRPTGLNDKWPTGSRPILSQGDVAVGRIHRKDVATLLVDMLATPEATGKTFEAITLAGYPPPNSMGPILEKLALDREGGPSMEQLAATYAAMQQLLPGEKQDSSALALGQTYEQLDKNQEGRFGPKGEERVAEIPIRLS